MLLFAVAIVFIGLGWHSAATSGSGSSSDVATAGETQDPTTEPSEETQPASETSESAAPTSDADSSSTKPTLCVVNAGNTDGARADLAGQLEAEGYTIKDVTIPGSATNNLRGGGFEENTIFYDDGEQDAAQALAELITPTPSVEARNGRTSQCVGELVVFVVEGYGPE